jgi:uncharacterized protein (TIGR03437 family)
MRKLLGLLPGLLLLSPLLAQGQITGGNCSSSLLNGTYSFVLSGRAISTSNVVSAYLVGNGIATFDGQSKVTITLTVDTPQAVQKQMLLSGTYNVPSTCSGTMALTSGTTGSFNLTVWNGGTNFSLIGEDATYAYTGSGSPVPASCITATVSGGYSYSATGFNLSAANGINGAADEAGVLQFDGQGNVAYTYSLSQNGTATPLTATGTYTVTSACTGAVTLADSNGKAIGMNFSITNAAATSIDVIEASTSFIRTGTAHSVVLNPAQSIGNVASYALSSTPPGSVFVIFGSNLATKPVGAVTSTLPTTLLTTSVLINGESAPLFYADQNQIDAQMPWDITPGALATLVVKNGTATSNAAAVFVPATGTPGISVYGNNRAVVVNKDGSINSASAGAGVGDEVVAYFTGGGPVQTTAKLVSGAPAPSALTVTGANKVTLNNVTAKVAYIGLTPGSIGLYQVNFFVPQVAKGTYPLVITIAGQASNSPVMTVN